VGLLGPRNKPKVQSGDNWTVVKGKKKIRNSKDDFENRKECLKDGCHSVPGGHRFKQKDAEKYCKRHAHPDNRD
jgi:hypothetical protein